MGDTGVEISAGNELDRAIQIVSAAGYVVVREKSYKQAQVRQRIAEVRREAEEQAAEHARGWARDCLAEERRLRDRLTYVYGVAQAHGATQDQLRGPDCPPTPDPIGR